MINENPEDLKKIKESVEEFFQKMTIEGRVDVGSNTIELEDILKEKSETANSLQHDILEVSVRTDDPQILIGEGGQTLNEIQRILRTVINKKTGKLFYINLDINDYKKKKIEYLKNLARNLADEALLSKEPKIFPPMSSYERKIVHMELADRTDIKTESEGEEPYRKVVIKPC